MVLAWKTGATGAGSAAYVTVDGLLDYSPQGSANVMCEVFKMEAQYLGFNCSFDGGHLCGWFNSLSDHTGDWGVSQDIDTFTGMAQPWYNDEYFNGPFWDFNRGSKCFKYSLPIS